MKTAQGELIWKIKRWHSGIFKILIIILVMFSSFTDMTYAITGDEGNLKTWNQQDWNGIYNPHLAEVYESDDDFSVESWWEKWLRNTFIKIALDLKNLFFIIAWVYFLIIVLKLLFSPKTDEEVSNFKKWIIWISIWIIVTQISYFIIIELFDKGIDMELAEGFAKALIEPFIAFLMTAASFIFLLMMIYAFFIMVTANWDEEQAKKWKMTVLYAIIWFIIIKIAEALVTAIYSMTSTGPISSPEITTNVTWFALLIIKIINWMNGFVWIIVILMIIFAGFMVITGAWDEEKLKKAKMSIIYIAIWVFILIINYLILTFFIFPEWAWI